VCGFAGAIEQGCTADAWRERLESMGDRLRHRGPDDRGVWWDAEAGVGLSHRRLSILDVSTAGRQPMHSPNGRFVIAYNGEIYNFLEIRADIALAGTRWKSRSDTEVMLAAFETWGVEEAVRRFNGMFAFAVWDRHERVVWLVRDRLGIKPLYYGEGDGALLFGSELKALRAHPAFRDTLDRQAVSSLLRYGYIPAPKSVHRHVRKLEPGRTLRIPAGATSFAEIDSREYWSLADVAERGVRSPFSGNEEDASVELERLLRQAVRRRMVSDVPLGAFLSGGVDSSMVVALMQDVAERPVKTFSIGFGEAGYDESSHAREVARHLGCDHTERHVSSDDARAVIPGLPEMYDEPFADPSQIPTAMVSDLARQDVTVSLSGDGGDELFAGYKRYAVGRDLWKMLRPWPAGVRALLATGLRTPPTGLIDRLFRGLGPRLNRYGREGSAGDKLKKAAEFLGSRDAMELYRGVTSLWQRPDNVLRARGDSAIDEVEREWRTFPELTHSMMLVDGRVYLPDDILTKVDRASMAVGLEARVPLLDHELVEFAWSLPLSMSLGGDREKRLLRSVLHRHVPKEIVDRPKMGFGAPVGAWIRGPLRPWAEELLDAGRLDREGVFNSRAVRRRFEEHLSGRRRWGHHLWAVLMFQAWSATSEGRFHV